MLNLLKRSVYLKVNVSDLTI